VIRLPASRKRLVALFLGLSLVVALVLAAATSGLGTPSVPSGAVAVVEDVENGTVSDADYEDALQQSTERLGLETPPEQGTPEFDQVNQEAMQGLLFERWVEGEAADRGIEISDTDVDDELTQIREGFQSEKEFKRAVRQSGFCSEEEIEADVSPIECEDVVNQGRLLAIQRRLQEAFDADAEVEISDAEIEDFYDARPELFETPATRSARVILNSDEAEVEKAREQLEGLTPEDEGYAKAWNEAAKKYSQDQASKDRGGLLEGLVEGQGDPQLDEEVFAAAEGELVGPFESDRGFYLVQVVSSQEAATQELDDETRENIRQQLLAGRQQRAQADTQSAFVEKWTSRTVCDEDVVIALCSNFVPEAPDPIPGQPGAADAAPVNREQIIGQQALSPGQPATPLRGPIAPGTAAFSEDGAPQSGPPQSVQYPLPEPAPADAGVPGVLGPDGAPAPGGGAPPGATP
jgi:parvulin-like peptidyl-prolyl isomerase